MPEGTTVRAEFIVVGDEFSLASVSQQLSMVPEKSWFKGERVGDKPIYRKNTAWYIGTDYEESLDVNTQINTILDQLEARKEALLALRKAMDVAYLFSLVVCVKGSQTPAMCFTTRFIRFMSDIGAELHIDLYCD